MEGVAPIKEEYVLRRSQEFSIEEFDTGNSEEVKGDDSANSYEAHELDAGANQMMVSNKRKKKERGQNKKRPRTVPMQKQSERLCPNLSSEDGKCHNSECHYLHDIQEYMQNKPEDIGDKCVNYQLKGKCIYGLECRFAKCHISDDFKNIIDHTKYKPTPEEQSKKSELQTRLRKKQYPFPRASEYLKRIDYYQRGAMQAGFPPAEARTGPDFNRMDHYQRGAMQAGFPPAEARTGPDFDRMDHYQRGAMPTGFPPAEARTGRDFDRMDRYQRGAMPTGFPPAEARTGPDFDRMHHYQRGAIPTGFPPAEARTGPDFDRMDRYQRGAMPTGFPPADARTGPDFDRMDHYQRGAMSTGFPPAEARTGRDFDRMDRYQRGAIPTGFPPADARTGPDFDRMDHYQRGAMSTGFPPAEARTGPNLNRMDHYQRGAMSTGFPPAEARTGSNRNRMDPYQRGAMSTGFPPAEARTGPNLNRMDHYQRGAMPTGFPPVEARTGPDVKRMDPYQRGAMQTGLPPAEARIGPASDKDIVRLNTREKKKIDFSDKLYLAPLTTVGNLPFRRVCKEFGADITCGEMAMSKNLLQGQQSEWALIRKHPSEDIFGVQLCGSFPDTMARCTEMLSNEIDLEFIDVNIGCPIDLVFKKGGGCALMGRQRKFEQIVRGMVEVSDVPITVKMRTGIYEKNWNAHEIIPKIRDWGASLVTLHGRSREQRYTRQADWDYINKCAAAASPIPLYGNGDILSFEDATLRREKTGVAGLMIARGALIKPWIFTEIKEQRHWDISASERFEILREYTNYGLEHWGSDNKGVENTRRFMLEWLSFLHRYIPVGLLEVLPQKINARPPVYFGRNDLETLMASSNCADWIKISEMLLGAVPSNFTFLPKHKANSYS